MELYELKISWVFIYYNSVNFLYMKFLIQFLVTAAVIYCIAMYNVVPGITLQDGYASALIFAVILALVNLFLGTILRIITFPLRLITLGLFSFVISVIVVLVTDQLVPVIVLSGIIPAVVVAFVMSITVFILKIFD